MKLLIYDIESLVNLFTLTTYDRVSKETKQYVIHQTRNDLKEMIKHLFEDPQTIMVGFNNVKYDYPVLHHIINHLQEYSRLDGDTLARFIYRKSQDIIMMEYSSVSSENEHIPQIDLFLIHHWDNVARSCSLKACEFALNMEKIEEMPYHHTMEVLFKKEINEILKYNEWDVQATNKVYEVTVGNTDHPVYKGKNKLTLRQQLGKHYGMNLINYNDVKMGETLVSKLYSEKTGIPMFKLRKMRTQRDAIALKECIPDYIQFKTPDFQKVYDYYFNKVITNTKKSEAFNIIYQDVKIEYGLGGLHQGLQGIYESDKDWVIIDADVASMYPSIIVKNGYYPEHLGKEFLELYAHFLNTRLEEKKKPKKERDPVIMEGYKLFVNGIKYLNFL